MCYYNWDVTGHMKLTISHRGEFDNGVQGDLYVGQFFLGKVSEVGQNTSHHSLRTCIYIYYVHTYMYLSQSWTHVHVLSTLNSA